MQALDDHSDTVYSSVNALQATAWRINWVVLDVLETCWANGGGEAGLAEAEDRRIPLAYAINGDDTEWRAKAEQVYRYNARLAGRRLALLQVLEFAQEFREEIFYFPYQCDFRGRIYPIPQFLQPQGCDVARGLLMFADSKPLGERGLWWLRVQYANCWGVDKCSFDDRVEWTDRKLSQMNQMVCLARAGTKMPSPFEIKHLWAAADDPWQALATLVEIFSAYHSGDPSTYESSLPVSVDGSNSGLQHFSAMLRDEEGARLVNLAPCETPNDIYADVAVCVNRMVRADTDARKVDGEVVPQLRAMLGDSWVDSMEKYDRLDTTLLELPGQWLQQGLGRKTCKRGTMTYCYGVTQQGLKDALIVDGLVDWAPNQFAAARYIGKKIWAAIQENITGAAEAMTWLRKCATCANKAEVLLEWITPSGFHVGHPYLEPKVRRIKCLSGELRFRVYDPDAEVRHHKQRNSLPPNFVHSLDASHLMMTVSAGSACGITHWMMIHDSFGTHAGQVDLMRDVLREQFVCLYEIDVLEIFRQQVIAQTGHDPGPPPERGSFDLSLVHESEYIFA